MRLTPALAALVIAASATFLPAGAEPAASRLFVFQRDDTDRLDLHVFIPYRAETPGLAHYVEHLAWLAATGVWADRGQGRTGAWTNTHTLHYWISSRNCSLDELAGTIGGIFEPLTLAGEFALSEREVVLREYRQREDEEPLHGIFEQINVDLYRGNPAAVPVLGDPDVIRTLDLAEALTLHARTHSVPNAAFLVDGNIPAETALRVLGQLGLSETGAAPDPIQRPGFELAAARRIVVHLFWEALAPLVVWRRVIQLDKEVPFEALAAKAELLGMILGTNRPGGLVKALQYDQEMARSISIGLHAIDGRHVELSFVARPDRGVTLTRLIEAIEQVLAETASAGIPLATHDRIVEQHARRWPDWNDRAEVTEYMKALSLERLSQWRPPPDEETIRNLHGQLPLPAINDLLGELAGEGRTVVALINPEGAAK